MGERNAPRKGWWRVGVRLAVAGGLTAAGVGAHAMTASAASVGGVSFPGPTSCRALSERFNGGDPWTEIRFSVLPGVGGSASAQARGVSVTIHRTSETSFDWHASDGIDLVWVNAGKGASPHSAAYQYRPEATGDSDLSGIAGPDPIDHIVVCFDPDRPVATTSPPTTAVVTTPPTTAANTIPPDTVPDTPATTPNPSTPPETVRSFPPQQRTPTPQASTPATAVTQALTLPETGADAGLLVAAGLTLVGLGTVTLAFLRRRSATES